MKILFLVNEAGAISPTQTTALLIHGAVKREHEVLVAGASELSCDNNGRPFASVRSLGSSPYSSATEVVEALRLLPKSFVMLDRCDAILIRINPARDMRPQQLMLLLQLLRMCETKGITVLNSPYGLSKASSKLFLLEFPESTRPQTLVSQQADIILEFIRDLDGPAVIKPLNGTRGNMVFQIASRDDKNIHQIIEAVLQQDTAMVQAFVPEAGEGDTRVVLLNGEPLSVNGKIAAVRRKPASNDFRSNIHAGGTALPGVVTPDMQDTLAAIKGTLIENGLFLVGADMIGNKIIELNCFSTGGLHDATNFEQAPFIPEVLKEIENITS